MKPYSVVVAVVAATVWLEGCGAGVPTTAKRHTGVLFSGGNDRQRLLSSRLYGDDAAAAGDESLLRRPDDDSQWSPRQQDKSQGRRLQQTAADLGSNSAASDVDAARGNNDPIHDPNEHVHGGDAHNHGDAHDDDDDDHGHHHHHHDGSGSTSLVLNKLGALVMMLAVGFLGCAASYFLEHRGAAGKVSGYVNAFACGAFMGLAFFHLLPEALLVTDELHVGFQVGQSWYNLTFLLSFLGFVLIMIFEKVLLVGVASKDAGAAVFASHDSEHSASTDDIEKNTAEPDGTHGSSPAGKKGGDFFPTESAVTATAKGKDGRPAVDKRTENTGEIAFSPTALFASVSLSIHSVFEGIIVGLFEDAVTVWVATLSISGHKWAAGFALAVNCIRKRVKKQAAYLYLSVFVLSSPIGVIIGIFVAQGNSVVAGVVNGISLGTILYTGCELLFDLFKGTGKIFEELIKFACFLLGSAVVFSLMMLHLSKASHAHGVLTTGI